MKKILTTLFAVCAFYGYSQAQTSAGTTELGVFAGIGGSTVTNGSNQNTNNNLLFVFNAGVSADYYFSDRWSLKVKALYDQKGWSNGFLSFTSGSGTTNYYYVDYKVNYITVPVMANWHFGRNRNWFLNFGPYVGFLMSAKTSGGYNSDVKYLFNSTDAGLAYGIGIKFPMTERTKFYIELDGQSGVSDALKGSGDAFLNSRSGLSVGLNF